jgi:hypothetical protein
MKNFGFGMHKVKTSFFKTGMILLLCFALFAVFPANQTPYRFVAIGDFGCGCKAQGEIARQMLDWHRKHPFQTVITTGDNIYPAWNSPGGHQKLFPERFDKYYKPLLDRGVKFHASLGNHDVETAEGKHEIADRYRFNILGSDGYYSFLGGPKVDGSPLIGFFALNSCRFLDRPADADQSAWLSRALTESKTIWKVAYFHHPIYTPDSSHKAELPLRAAIERILMAGGVKIVFQGHNHFYARSKPQHGITYITTGGGGRELYKIRLDDQVAKAVRTNHFVYVEVFEEKLVYQAISAAGAVIDHGTLRKTE